MVDIILTILIYLGVIITIGSYIYLIYFFIKEEIYKNPDLFDFIILALGPIGLLFVIIMGYMSYNDKDFPN